MKSLARFLSGGGGGVGKQGSEKVVDKQAWAKRRAHDDEAERDKIGDTISDMPQKGYQPAKHEPGGKFSGDSAYMGSDSRASGTSNTSESSPHRRTFADSLSQDSEDRLSTQMKQSTLSRVSNDTARAESIDTGPDVSGRNSFQLERQDSLPANRLTAGTDPSTLQDAFGSATDVSDGLSHANGMSSGASSLRRSSRDSRASETSSGRSRRSSFALERASFESNRASLEIFRRSMQMAAPIPETHIKDPSALCKALQIPEGLWDRFLALAVVPVDTPLPMSMLQRLWSVPSTHDAEATANLLSQLGVMKVACLTDNTAWALVQPGHLKALTELLAGDVKHVHEKLLEAYRGPNSLSLADVPDDGYIMQNAGHHLMHTQQLEGLKEVLMRSAWLECKLHSYGAASVVSDFRRYLMVETDDSIKLLLEAFQMSVSACLAHPTVAMLHEQLLGRLMLARQDSQVHLNELPLATSQGALPQKTISLKTRTASLEQAGGLQRMTLRGHSGGVQKVLLTPGGIDVITNFPAGSTDGTSRVWDMEIGDCVLMLEGHTGPLKDMATAADGSVVVTASEDGTARAWDLDEGTCISIMVGHSGAVNAVAVESTGKFAVTGGADGTGRVWDLQSGNCIQLLLGHTSLGALHKVVLTRDCNRVITCSSDFTTRVWEVLSGNCIQSFSGHTNWVVDAALTSDSSLLITASHDRSARVWNMLSGRLVHVLNGHTGRLNAVRVSPDNSAVITVSDDFTARVFDLNTGKCRHTLEGHGGWVSDCAVHPDSNSAITVSGDDLAVVWDLISGSCKNVLEGHSGEILSVVMTRRGRFAVTGSNDGTARIWDLAAGSAHLQRAHTGRVHGLVATPDESTVVSFGDDGCLIWNVDNGSCTASLEGPAVRWAACLDAGKQLLCASGDRTTRLWDLQSKTSKTALPGSRGSRVKSWSASQDGCTAVVVLFDSTVTVWDMEHQEQAAVLQRWGQRAASLGHTEGVNAAYITSDGRRVVTVSKDCTARVWDVAKGKPIHVLEGHKDGVTGACLSSDCKKAVTLSYDHTARLWDIETGECLGNMQHGGAVTRAAFSKDNTLLITASADNLSFLWKCDAAHKPHPVQIFKGHKEEIRGVAISSDMRWAATCSRDNCLRLWSNETGRAEGCFVADAGLTCCTFAGNTLISGDDSGILHLLQLPTTASDQLQQSKQRLQLSY